MEALAEAWVMVTAWEGELNRAYKAPKEVAVPLVDLAVTTDYQRYKVGKAVHRTPEAKALLH